MKYFLLLSGLLIFFDSGSAHAESRSVDPLVKLNRLNRILKGKQPSDLERMELEKAISGGSEKTYLENKTDEYLKSPDHAYKMSVRLEELFRLKTNESPLPDSLKENPAVNNQLNYFMYSRNNALNDLFLRMAEQNLSWDQLLTAKNYRAYYLWRNRFVGLSDFGFLSALVPDLNAADGTYGDAPVPAATGEIPYRDIQFAANEKQIAGAVTTARFFTRYVNTGLNKNRKRAAALFRIFLCDSMSAAVPSSDGKDDHILDVMFPHEGVTEDQLRSAMNSADKLHGDRPDCMACHYKLDPMGKTFLTSPLVLSNVPSPGHLTYKKAGGDMVNIPVAGLADLGQAITAQTEYTHCQVKHFWSWFMGDQTLSSEKENFLVGEFEKEGRRTNDFIKVLSRQDEFYTLNAPLSESQLRTRELKVFLQKCDSCHKDSIRDPGEEPIPAFAVWPIGGDATSMKTWLRRIQKKMDLDHDGENPTMPPLEATWRTGFKEIQLIKAWIQAGTPDEDGKKQVAP